jgi:transcriptional regulator with XRE-family HTH domain
VTSVEAGQSSVKFLAHAGEDLSQRFPYTAAMEMLILKQRRRELRMTQRQLAELVGVPQQRICDYESGLRSPHPDVRKKLIDALGCATEFAGVPMRIPARMQRFVLPGTEELQVDEGNNWLTFGEQLEHRYNPKTMPCLAFRRAIRADSQSEVRALRSLCEAGAQPCALSPVAMLYLRHPLVDGNGWALGLRSKACLFLDYDTWHAVLFPGLNLRLADGLVRPDALLRVSDGERVHWCAYEIDGPQHRETMVLDRQRDLRLDMTVLRFWTDEFNDRNFPTLLHRALVKLFGQKA